MKSKNFWSLALAAVVFFATASASAQIRVAVEKGPSTDNSAVQLAAQLNDDTHFDFTATVVSAGQIDSSAELASYDVVVLGDSGFDNDDLTQAMADALVAELRAGNIGVVTAGWFDYTTRSTAVDATLDNVTPIDAAPHIYNYCNASSVSVPSPNSHPVTTGLPTSITLTTSSQMEYSSRPLDGTNAVSLGSCPGSTGNRVIVVGEESAGRTVYLGLLYMARTTYNNGDLRSGAPDRLLEQAVAWVAGDGDRDGDGIPNASDNCVAIANPSQTDADADGIGDACDAPAVANGDTYAIDEDTSLTVASPGVLANDTDADADTLTAALDTGASNGTVVLDADGSFVYTPVADFNGSDSFTYVANDGTNDSAPATVMITVANTNDAPEFTSTATTAVDEDAPNTYDVTASDIDPGDTLTVTATTLPGWLTLVDHGDGTATLSGTPQNGDVGLHAVVLEVADGNGASDTQSFDITVANTNDAPLAQDDSSAVDEEATLSVAAPGVLANDTDDDGDALTATLTSGVSHGGLVLLDDGSYSYTPNADFFGTDSFTYEVSDGNGGTDSATVTIVVNNVNDAPVFVAPTPDDLEVLTAAEGDELAFTLAAVDADADALTYAVTATPSAASFDPVTGAFSWTPTWQDAGSHTFALDVTDGQAGDARSITVEVSFLDADADELPDTWEVENGLDPTTPDSDADQIADADEVGDDLDNPRDTDADQTLDALDDDSDDDGLLDIDEAGDDDLLTAPVDTDGDTTPDYLDTDSDDDAVDDTSDNCRLVNNPEQVDTDQDGEGDACEDDADGDTVEDADDNCPLVGNLDQLDTDQDGAGDACDGDDDEDTVEDDADNCPLAANTDQVDTDEDTLGDACDDDDDDDSLLDADDDCPLVAGDGLDGCPLDESTGTASAGDGCGCSSTESGGLPGRALMVMFVAASMALLRRRRLG